MLRPPKYRKHTLRNFGFIEWNGHRHRLPGEYNSPESKEAYKKFLAEEVYGQERQVDRPKGRLGLGELILMYDSFAESYYPPAPSEYDFIKASISPLLELFPTLVANEFGPLKLKQYQAYLDKPDVTRNYVNGRIRRVKQMFKWAASEELVPVTVYQALLTVPGLKAGRSQSKESAPKQPVPWSHVDAVLKSMPPTLRAMVLLQWHCGARGQNIISLRPCDLDRTQSPVVWKPPKHKTVHHGHELTIFLGPQAMKAIEPFLDCGPEEYCFSPRDSATWIADQREKNRKSKRTPGQKRVGVNRRIGKRYSSRTYRQAIEYAIDRCNKERKELDLEAIPKWGPHMLRHAKATELRKKYGLEEAQVTLGHKSLDITQVYAQKNLDLARKIAMESG